jgi:dTDP-4-dehydrorhamnose reductase
VRALVTGGGGQLGRAFAKLFPDAVVLNRSELDITDAESIEAALTSVRPDVLVNAAAFTAVDAAEAQAEEAMRVNVEAVIKLAQAARRAGATLVQPSTDYVFSGEKQGPYTERDRTRPLSVYGRSKLQSEVAARAAGGKSLIVRTSWVFGDGKNFIRSIVDAAARLEALDVVDDQRGRPTHAEDLAKAIVKLAEEDSTGVFNVTGSGEAGSWADVAEEAIHAAGLDAVVRRVTTAQYYAGRAGPVAPRPANSELDCSLAESAGVELRPWRDAVTAYVKEMLL